MPKTATISKVDFQGFLQEKLFFLKPRDGEALSFVLDLAYELAGKVGRRLQKSGNWVEGEIELEVLATAVKEPTVEVQQLKQIECWANEIWPEPEEAKEKVLDRISLCIEKRKLRLDLSDCELANIPEQLGGFTWLKELDLSKNQLATPPRCLPTLLSHLEILDVSENALTTLPAFPSREGGVPLRVLNISGNRLEWLPFELGECQKLEYLDFSNNQIKVIPHTLEALADLKVIRTGGNPVVNLAAIRWPAFLQLAESENLEMLVSRF
jgi:Leucine-rich repeat (LRR) protein